MNTIYIYEEEKSQIQTYNNSSNKSYFRLNSFRHLDPSSPSSKGGTRYMLTFIEDYCFDLFPKKKSDIFLSFK